MPAVKIDPSHIRPLFLQIPQIQAQQAIQGRQVHEAHVEGDLAVPVVQGIVLIAFIFLS